ncbi:MAG: dihydropteroate synthase [Synechococcales cyanobacterium T60_A2020_003]|nr:dihydropteroate synthase [Synechococcales cyanobacterium T60_A2020_003]
MQTRAIAPLTVRGVTFDWGTRTYLMGVLNVTPDSFSDGGQFNTIERAIAQAHYLVESGADILDIGGQSTRPQAEDVSEEEEMARVIPVIQGIRTGYGNHPPLTTPISIDTTKASVAREAIAAGADIVNDISGATFDAQMLATVAELGVPLILMHLRGTPKTMQQLTDYDDVVADVREFLHQRLQSALAIGIPKSHLIIDPGIGFAKTVDQNLELLRRTADLRSLSVPVLIGTSRKSFIGHILNQPDPNQRVWGTAASCCAAIAHHADILRVHDVAQMRDVSRVADAIWRSP